MRPAGLARTPVCAPPGGMSVLVRIMEPKAGRPPWTMERQADMTNHNGVLMMQRMLLAGTLGLAMAQKAAAILEGEPATTDPELPDPEMLVPPVLDSQHAPDPRSND